MSKCFYCEKEFDDLELQIYILRQEPYTYENFQIIKLCEECAEKEMGRN